MVGLGRTILFLVLDSKPIAVFAPIGVFISLVVIAHFVFRLFAEFVFVRFILGSPYSILCVPFSAAAAFVEFCTDLRAPLFPQTVNPGDVYKDWGGEAG